MFKNLFYPFTLLALSSVAVHAVVFIIPGDPSDVSIGLNDSVQPIIGWNGDGGLQMGDDNAEFNKDDQAGIAVFELPDLAGETIGTASLDFTFTSGAFLGPGGDGLPKGVDVYGLRTSSSNAVQTSDYGFGSTPGNGDLIQDDIFVITNSEPFPGAVSISTDATGDANLASWLQNQYDNGANAGDYVFIRLNLDDATNNALAFGSANNATEANRPSLTIATVPEPTAYAALLGLLVLGWVYVRKR